MVACWGFTSAYMGGGMGHGSHICIQVYDIMVACWGFTPETRPSFAQLGTILTEAPQGGGQCRGSTGCGARHGATCSAKNRARGHAQGMHM